jgi:methionyl-tRNA formyltransferase
MLKNAGADFFIVAAYGKIIPQAILDIPKHGTLNMHPSLLPKLRGASPIRSAILQHEYPTGVSIMLLTPGLDKGPIVAQEVAEIEAAAWPMRGMELDTLLSHQGGALLARILPDWLAGKITLHEQDDACATYCAKITKDMALIDLNAGPEENLHKIRAFDGWPGAYYFHEKTDGTRIRVKITDAEIRDNTLTLLRVIPEGKKEMSYEDFLRGV